MKQIALFFSLSLLAIPLTVCGQSSSPSMNQLVAENPASGAIVQQASLEPVAGPMRPFSRLAIGGGFSPLGVRVMAATNLNRYMDVRAVGNVFSYNVNGITVDSLNVNGKLNLASAGASLDFYPFPNHGLRLSPGVLFYNTNQAAATITVPGGTSFTLNNFTYYASSTNPIAGTALLSLHGQNPAFTITGGWGSMIPRRGGHWSFPFEVGVALIGSPHLKMTLNSGQACDSAGQNCVDVADYPSLQSNLQAQTAKYQNDLNPLKTFPIVSGGIAYNFGIR
jgi:hypothetical protein